MNYLYLIVDLAALSVPFLFSFHPKIQLYKKWIALWPALLLTTLFFGVWDNYFTALGVWGFNPRYVTGYYLFNLPIEEILFFICIPYACLFTYFCFNIFLGNAFKIKYERQITLGIMIIILASGIIFYDRIYTLYTCLVLGILLILLQFVLKVKWLSLFFYSHMFLLFPFFIVNGILTGTGPEEPVVWYNASEIIGTRLMTIPIEDVFYGMAMLFFNTLLFEIFSKRSASV